MLNLIGLLLALTTLLTRTVNVRWIKLVALDESYRINTLVHSFVLVLQSALTLLIGVIAACGAERTDGLGTAALLTTSAFVFHLLFKIYKLAMSVAKVWASRHLMPVAHPSAFVVGGFLSMAWELSAVVVIGTAASSISCGLGLMGSVLGLLLLVIPAIYISYMNNESVASHSTLSTPTRTHTPHALSN